MTCYNCGKKITHKRSDEFGELKGEIAAEVYSLESGMCVSCRTQYVEWCVENGVSPQDGGYNSAEMTNLTVN